MPASKKTELQRWLAAHTPRQIGEPEQQAIASALAPISPGYLRRLLRESGVPLAPQVEGVRQETFEALEHSLVALSEIYESGHHSVRTLVIEAKDHAKLAARSAGTASPRHGTKQEMVLWMLTWLENPPLFPQWVKLRKHAQADPQEAENT